MDDGRDLFSCYAESHLSVQVLSHLAVTVNYVGRNQMKVSSRADESRYTSIVSYSGQEEDCSCDKILISYQTIILMTTYFLLIFNFHARIASISHHIREASDRVTYVVVMMTFSVT